MSLRIFPVHMGFDTCYLIQAEGIILVDAGAPGKVGALLRRMKRVGIEQRGLRLVVITHGHWDHIGSAREIKDQTGAEIALHEYDAHLLEESLTPLSPGVTQWGRIMTALIKGFMPLVNVPSAGVDHRLGDDGMSLRPYGIPGMVIHTPGHTRGSVSVLLDTGEAFVGDLAMNRFPLRLAPGLPIFAEDGSQVQRSWRLLLNLGARTVYPAHGKPFPAEVMWEKVKIS
ncbi:MAG: MBL fold metallo-hydrolase [bacterium]|nr:MAG: MBL fold metallo-hydrolase [bacterium]